MAACATFDEKELKDLAPSELQQHVDAFLSSKRNVSDFKKLTLLGEGAGGEVYRGELEDKGRIFAFAIKRFPIAASTDADVKKMVAHEKAASPVVRKMVYSQKSPEQHDNVVFFFGEVKDDDNKNEALVFEICDGNANDLIKERRAAKCSFLSTEEVTVFASDLLCGLNDLHRHDFIHRDICLSNVLLVVRDKKIRVKLADFGLSRSCAFGTAAVTTGWKAFFPDTPPETRETKISAAPPITDAAHIESAKMLDAWSVGVVLAELLLLTDTRHEAVQKLHLIGADEKKQADLAAKLQNRLLCDLKSTATTPFREQVIEELLVSDPALRRSIASAYEHVQRLLRIVVAKLDLDFKKTQQYREDFLNRLKDLFAKATTTPGGEFDLLRMKPGCVVVHFRIIQDNEKDEQAVFDELSRQAQDPDSALRQDAIGKHILHIKRWELDDDGKRHALHQTKHSFESVPGAVDKAAKNNKGSAFTGDTSLMHAVRRGSLNSVAYLIANKADVNEQAEDSFALEVAAAVGHYDICEALLKARADPKLKNRSWNTAAEQAWNKGHSEVAYLVYAYPNKSVFRAAAKGDVRDMQACVEQGADLSREIFLQYDSVLVHAISNGNLPVAEFLTTIPAALDDWFKAAGVAWDKGYADLAYLIYARAQQGGKSLYGDIFRVAAKGDAKQLQVAINAASESDRANVFTGKFRNGDTVLAHAARFGKLDNVKAIIELKADVNYQPERGYPEGNPALHVAAEAGFYDVCEVLLKAGANNALTPACNNLTAPNVALAKGHTRVADLISLWGVQYREGEILSAASAADLNKLRQCLFLGANVNEHNGYKTTALLVAVRTGRAEAVQFLLTHKANPNLTDVFGRLPLFVAAAAGDRAVCEVLLKAGADVKQQFRGRSAVLPTVDKKSTESPANITTAHELTLQEFASRMRMPASEIPLVMEEWLRLPAETEPLIQKFWHYPEKLRIGHHSSVKDLPRFEDEMKRLLLSAKYELVPGKDIITAQQLAQTDFSDVFKCTLRSGKVVVAKVPKGNQPSLVLEWLATSRLPSHSNLLTPAGICFDFPTHLLPTADKIRPVALLMPFIDHGSIEACMHTLGATTVHADLQRQWLQEIAAAVNHLHTFGLVHRDIAARNVFLDAGNHAIVADFGLSKTAPREGGVYGKNFPKGYPWVLAEESKTFSTASDVFSIGVTCLDIASNLRFEEEAADLLEHVKRKQFNDLIERYLNQLPPTIPKDLIRRCLGEAKDRPTAEDIIVELALPPEVPTPKVLHDKGNHRLREMPQLSAHFCDVCLQKATKLYRCLQCGFDSCDECYEISKGVDGVMV